MQIVTNGDTIRLAGDLDVRSTDRVREAVRTALGEHRHVVVDLTDVGTVDLTALRVLAFASTRAVRSGHRIILRGCGPAVLRMLHLTRLIRVVELERDGVAV